MIYASKSVNHDGGVTIVIVTVATSLTNGEEILGVVWMSLMMDIVRKGHDGLVIYSFNLMMYGDVNS